MNTQMKHLILTILFVLLSILILAHATVKYIGSQSENFQMSQQEIFNSDMSQISLNVTRALSTLHHINGFILSNGFDEDFDEKFDIFTTNSQPDISIASHIIIAPEGVIEYVYPKHEKYRFNGRNFIRESSNSILDEQQRNEIEKEIQESLIFEKTLVLGPMNFPGNAGYGIILQKSIVENQDFWGLACLLVPLENLFQGTRINSEDASLNYAIRNHSGIVLLGDASIFENAAFQTSIEFPEGHWDIAAGIKSKTPYYNSVMEFIFIGLVLSLLSVVSTGIFLGRNQRLETIVHSRTAELKDSKNLFDAFMRYISIPISIENTKGEILFSNSAAGAMVEGLCPSGGHPLSNPDRHMQREESIQDGEIIRHYITHEFPIIQASEPLIGRIRFDISESKKKEREIHEQTKKIEALYRQTNAINEELNLLIEENRQIYFSTIKSLANTIDAKDHYTGGHCERVTKYALRLGRWIDLSADEMTDLFYAANIHDIGKIGISENILNKPGALSRDEFEILKKHPRIGHDIVKDIDFLKRSSRIILQHHERYDGKGYPSNIKGEEIDPLARILFIADAFDAMTTHRIYRKKPLNPSEAIHELKKNSGIQFDPALVDIFIKNHSSKQPS